MKKNNKIMWRLCNLFLILIVLFSSNYFSYLEVEGAVTKPDINDEIPPGYVSLYQKAAQKYGVSWYLLASIHNQETNFSQNVSKSSAGAIGHTQFMRCTWVGWGYSGCKGTKGDSFAVTDKVLMDNSIIKKFGGYGVDGNQDGKSDPWDLVDAVYSMANYLSSGISSVKNEKGNVESAAMKYNHSSVYAKEISARYFRYKEGWKGAVAEGSDVLSGKHQEGMWTSETYDGLEGIKNADKGDGASKGDGVKLDEYVHDSPFNEYDLEIDNIGINDKSNHDTSYQNYKVNKLTGKLIEIFYNITFAFGIILIGYISILWMALLLARTRFEPAYKIVESLTNGKIDAFDDLGKLIKLTIVLMVIVGVTMSGLIPMIFVLVYKVLSIFISGVFRL